jgi:hypothetical protein
MTHFPSPARLLGAVAACAFFFGSAMVVQPAGATVVVVHPGYAQTFVKDHCPAHGGLRVTPCNITFDASNVGPDVVTLRAPGDKKDSVTELDTCGTAGIASIVPNPSNSDQYIVSAGSLAGMCTATFTLINKHGKVIGYAGLNVTNNL